METTIQQPAEHGHGTLASYSIGLALSIILTLIPLGLFAWHVHTHHLFPTHQELRTSFTALAVVQLMVQLFFFLDLAKEPKPRWNSIAAAFALFVVAVIVGGSLWIMSHLQHPDTLGTFINGVVTPANEED